MFPIFSTNSFSFPPLSSLFSLSPVPVSSPLPLVRECLLSQEEKKKEKEKAEALFSTRKEKKKKTRREKCQSANTS